LFRGRFEHTIDSKGRVSIPSRFREVLQSQYGSEDLVLTVYDSCIVAFPWEEWRRWEERLKELPLLRAETKRFFRYFLSGAVDCRIDDHGRLLIPAQMRVQAQLKKEVVLVGMLKGFEIWDKELWQEEMLRCQEMFDKVSETIAEWMGF